jgi:hypothetical protein
MAQLKIGNLTAEMHQDFESSDCFVALNKGGICIAGNSLAMVEAYSGIELDDGSVYPVSDDTFRRIETWANNNGY